MDFLLRIKPENHHPHRDNLFFPFWKIFFLLSERGLCVRPVSENACIYPHTQIDTLIVLLLHCLKLCISVKAIHCLLRICCISDTDLGAQNTSTNMGSPCPLGAYILASVSGLRD